MRFVGLGLVLFVLGAIAANPAFAAGASSSAHAESESSPYFAVKAMPTSIIYKGHSGGLLVVEIGLEAESVAGREYVQHILPRLRDLYVQVLNLYASRDLKPDHPPDVEVIGERLQAATDQILGEDHHAKVLFRQIIVRPPH